MMYHHTRNAVMASLVTLALGAFTLGPTFAMGRHAPAPEPPADEQPDPVQRMHDFLHDPSQSTTPADVFIPGSTIPVRSDDPAPEPSPAPEPPQEPAPDPSPEP